METLKEVSEEVSPFVGDSGTCPDSPLVRDDINRARRLLYKLGDWKNTTQDIIIQSYNGTVTLPPWFEHITKMWTPTRSVILPNEWWAVVTMALDDMCATPCKPIRMTEPVVQFNELKWIYGEECFFRVELMWESYNEKENENLDGLEIIIHGYDQEAQKRSIKRIYGKAYDKETADPINDFYFRTVYQITKPKTEGRVRMYAINPSTGKRLLVSLFEANDVNPTMTRYLVEGGGCCRCHGNPISTNTQYVLTAKKKYVPIVDDNHPVDIATEALIHGVKALVARRSGDIPTMGTQLEVAVGYLNRELGENQANELGRIKTAMADVQGLIE